MCKYIDTPDDSRTAPAAASRGRGRKALFSQRTQALVLVPSKELCKQTYMAHAMTDDRFRITSLVSGPCPRMPPDVLVTPVPKSHIPPMVQFPNIHISVIPVSLDSGPMFAKWTQDRGNSRSGQCQYVMDILYYTKRSNSYCSPCCHNASRSR